MYPLLIYVLKCLPHSFKEKLGDSMSQCKRNYWFPPTWKCHLGDTFPSGKAYFSKITTVYSLKLPFGYFEPFNWNIRSFCRRANISHIYICIYITSFLLTKWKQWTGPLFIKKKIITLKVIIKIKHFMFSYREAYRYYL